jgi:flagellar hook assembly protein FlgD
MTAKVADIARADDMETRGRRSASASLVFVALALLTLVAWSTPAAFGAASASRPTAVRLHAMRLPGGDRLALACAGARGAAAPVTLDAGARFSLAGVICDVPRARRGAVTIRLRTSLDGKAWGAWFAAPLEIVDEGGRGQAYTDPLWTGPARYVQVKARASSGAGSALSGVRVVAIDPATAGSRGVGGSDAVGKAAGVTAAGLVSPAVTTKPAIVTRAQWGADESLRSGSPSYAPVKMAFIHHTASGNDYTQAQAPGIVAAIYAYHTRSLHWNDIGYNFLVDRYGTIYEGRYGGVARGVVGAQAGGFNTGSTGISVLGTFVDVAPPAAVLTSVEQLLAWKLGVAGLDPNGTAQLTCGLTDKYKLGALVTFPVIAGHRDANFTECPGDKFYALLPAVRTKVAKLMSASPSPTPSPSPSPSPIVARLQADTSLISPNGDGVLDEVALSASLSAAADWRITVHNAAGKSVASWGGNGDATAVTWKGTASGDVVADGVYTAELTASSAGGDSTTATVTITVDTSAPRLKSAGATPLTFSPNGDGRNEAVTLSYSPAESCSVRVGVQDADGQVLRWLNGWHAVKAATQSATWDGRIASGGRLVATVDGLYRFRIERRDTAGNIARQGVAVTLDRCLGFPTAAPGTFSPNGDSVRDTTVLGFKLAGAATVTVQVAVGTEVARTFKLGSLGAGAHTVTWDGKAASGDVVVSGRPTFTVKAISALGESSVTKGLVVDLVAPRLYATRGLAVALGGSARMSYKAIDPLSKKADVSFVVTDSKGRRVATRRLGLTATNRASGATWKPASRGTFTVTWHAVDLGGNVEAAPAHTVVTVR